MNRWPLVAFFVLATLHFPVAHFTGLPLMWGAWLLCMVVAVLETDLRGPSILYFLCYGAAIGVAVLVTTLRQVISPNLILLASTSYWVLPLIFMATLQRDTEARLRSIAAANAFIAVSAGLAAIYQLTKDPVLFGLYANTSYESISSWATPRASSWFGSPQVYSAYMVFSVILFDGFRTKRWFIDFPVLAFLSVTALFSGSVTSIAGIGLYFAVRLYLAHRRVFWFASAMVCAVGLAVYFSFDFIETFGVRSPLYRLAAVVHGGLGNDERIGSWVAALGSSPSYGNGVGSASTLVSGASRFNTESYLLSLYYEGGIFLLAAPFILLGKLAASGVGARRTQKAGFIAVFLLMAMVVNAFYAWSLPIVWVLLFGFISLGATSNQSNRLRQLETSP